ncbi:MAG: hypothetical protein ACLS29_01390, partial [Prevotellamassilia sp.]
SKGLKILVSPVRFLVAPPAKLRNASLSSISEFFVLVTIPNNHYESHYLNELKKGIKGRISMNTQLTTP